MESFYSHGFAAIAIVCLAVLCLSSGKRKNNLILLFIQRGIVGFMAIAGLNTLFASLAIKLFVGINVWTLLTSTILGIPGVCMLYFISLF